MRRWLAAIVVLALAVGSLHASVGVPMEFGEVVATSDVIVRGHVTDVRAIRVEDAGVDSVATVAIDSLLKGQADGFVYVRVPGGEMGRYRFVMTGAPTLRLNETAVFFLQRNADGTCRPVGLSSGIFAIDRDAATGQPVVQPPLLQGYTAGTGQIVRGDARRKPLPVSDFESLVRVVMTGLTGRTAKVRE